MKRKEREQPGVTTSTRPSVLDSSFTVIYLTTILTTLIISVSAAGNEMLGNFLTSESSPIQIFSAVGYLLAFVTALFLNWKRQISFGLEAAVILLAMGLRELDFHERFTTMGIMKSRFYISDAVPLSEKIIGAAILLGLACIIISFLIKNLRPFLTALKEGNKAALLVLHGLFFIIISNLIDSNACHFVYVIENYTPIDHVCEDSICALEESMEMAIPYFFLSAMLLYGKLKKEDN